MLTGFLIECNRNTITESSCFTEHTITGDAVPENGSFKQSRLFRYESCGLEVKDIVITYPDTKIINKLIEIRNISKDPLEITRVDTFNCILPPGDYMLKYYTSAWGREFEPADIRLREHKILECTAGRSSQGIHPWFSVTEADGFILTGSIAWSGNWIMRFEPEPDGSYRISGGLSNRLFTKSLKPGETMQAPHVIYVCLLNGSLNDTSVEFGKWGKKYWYPKNALADSMPVEWNTWWPYEDDMVNEAVFRDNVDKCAATGIEVCTLDAGWFGNTEHNADWYRVRGDWHKVNMHKFPSGIRALSDYTHSSGMKFGIWCEIEALGADAELNRLRPEIAAKRDGNPLGYICMGNPESVKWAFGVLETLIKDFKANWIKLDFNLDPGAGCNRTDHGHGTGDGLYEHYLGYYRLLDMIGAKYPEVLLENCSSGGLRIDLGMMRHLHTTFLSDPDYSEHVLQLHWGATTMLHTAKCLHWSWSQTRETFTANVENEPLKADMPLHKLDYIIRISMLGGFGFSYRMNEMPSLIQERLKHHIDFYKDRVRDFIRDSHMYRLTGQVLRGGGGDRWNAFQYITEDGGASLLFIFKLCGGEKERVIKPVMLDPDGMYLVEYEDNGRCLTMQGSEIMRGILFENLPEESSEVLFLHRQT